MFGYGPFQGTGVSGLAGADGRGVYGESRGNKGVAVYGNAVGGSGLAMYADGNAAQALGGYGWIKAMAYVRDDGIVVRCYNPSVAGGSGLAPCNIKVGHVNDPKRNTGLYTVDFGFPAGISFVSVTTQARQEFGGTTATFHFDPSFPNAVIVATYDLNSTRLQDNHFMIVVY